jgi:hypothetical protein
VAFLYQANGPTTSKIQRAADVGKKAWMPGSTTAGPEKVCVMEIIWRLCLLHTLAFLGVLNNWLMSMVCFVGDETSEGYPEQADA